MKYALAELFSKPVNLPGMEFPADALLMNIEPDVKLSFNEKIALALHSPGGKSHDQKTHGRRKTVKGPQRKENFKKWFGDSKVVDKDGKPLTVYHGTKVKEAFNKFDYEHMGKNGTAEGYGFYFTDDPKIASRYGSDGQVFATHLKIEKPLSGTSKEITRKELAKFISELDPTGQDYLANWGDSEYYGRDKVIDKAVEGEYNGSDNDVDMISGIINAGGGDAKNDYRTLKRVLGYDGIKVDNPEWGGDQVIYVPFFAENIKSATGNSGEYGIDEPNITLSEQIELILHADHDQKSHGNRGNFTKEQEVNFYTFEGKDSELYEVKHPGVDTPLAVIKVGEGMTVLIRPDGSRSEVVGKNKAGMDALLKQAGKKVAFPKRKAVPKNLEDGKYKVKGLPSAPTYELKGGEWYVGGKKLNNRVRKNLHLNLDRVKLQYDTGALKKVQDD